MRVTMTFSLQTLTSLTVGAVWPHARPYVFPYLVEPCDPKHRCHEEQRQRHPREPIHQLIVALNAHLEQLCEGLTE